jgi:hypothetical protein
MRQPSLRKQVVSVLELKRPPGRGIFLQGPRRDAARANPFDIVRLGF